MNTRPRRTYARLGVRDPARMYTYVAVFSFLHPGRCTYVYMLRARLYYDMCAPLHRPVCTYTFATRVQERKYGHVRTYGWGLECLLAHTYMAGSEWRNRVVVMFMGRQRNASCSGGGNGMRRVHGEATECVVFMGRQRNASCSSGGNGTRGSQPAGSENGMRGRVHRQGLDRTGDGNKAWRTAQRRKRTSYIRNRVLLIGRGVAYRKTEETDLLRSKQGSY